MIWLKGYGVINGCVCLPFGSADESSPFASN